MSHLEVFTSDPVIAAKTISFDNTGSGFTMSTTGEDVMFWLEDSIPIAAICLTLLLCVWMFFLYKKKRIVIQAQVLGDAIEERFSRVDERISNIETILLEKEKEQKYQDL